VSNLGDDRDGRTQRSAWRSQHMFIFWTLCKDHIKQERKYEHSITLPVSSFAFMYLENQKK
jgi:heme-degrading monooxygenase HmoA